MALLSAERFSPTLFIGLGGSGGKVVNVLAGKLQRHPLFSRFADLIHFLAIDTNKNDLSKLRSVPEANRFLISSFDKRAYAARKRGSRELPEDKFATAWIHSDYQFREAENPGAGQIRVESRLCVHYNLENDRAKIRSTIERVLALAARPGNPYRDHSDHGVNIMMYGSLAGGTGSGAYLPLAYVFQDIAKENGWRPNVVATLLLPSLFKKYVEQPLHADIDANAYAALKEIERAMRLGYEGCEPSLSLHHDPMHPEKGEVDSRPFSICYLIDAPGELTVEKYVQAIADASYLQIFSPILGEQAGGYDNYEKNQKSLALGHFTVHYGTLGASLLVLPRKDIIHYAALRYTARALEQAVLCATEPEFRVDVLDPKFQKLTRDEQERRIDNAFVAGVNHGASEEEKRDERSVYTGIVKHPMPDGRPMREGLHARLSKLWDDLESAIAISAADAVNITVESPTIAAAIEKMRREIAQAREKIDSEILVSLQAELRSGRFWDRFFSDAGGPTPLAQRYLLITLRNEEYLGPFEAPEQNESIKSARDNGGDLSSPTIKDGLATHARDLAATSEAGIFGRWRENRPFEEAKGKAVAELDRLAELNREALKVAFWQRFHEELQKSIQMRLATFRAVAQIADESVGQVQREAERFLADPASDPNFEGDATSYYLDTESLRDDRENKRLWDLLFEDRLGTPAYFDPQLLANEVTEAFRPEVLPGGQVRARDAASVVRLARERIYALGAQTFRNALEHDLKLDMHSALRLEAGYVALGPGRTRLTPQQRRDALDKVSEQEIARNIRDKIARAQESCVLLAQIDRTRFDDPTVTPNQIHYVGLASRYTSDEPGSLGEHLAAVSKGAQLVPAWEEPDLIVFYRSLLGIPVYFFKRINDELKRNYLAVRDKPNRTYPLHIDQRWETALPNLDPIEMKAAEEQRQRELAAGRAQAEREQRLRLFTLCHHLGHVVVREDGSYKWSVENAEGALGSSRAAAFDALFNLRASMVKDLEGFVAAFEAQGVGAAGKRKLAERLEQHYAVVKSLYYKAAEAENERELRLLEDEKAFVQQLLAKYKD